MPLLQPRVVVLPAPTLALSLTRAGAWVLALACAGCGGSGPRPNVLLITLDTVRPDYLSAYPGGRAGTPTLKALCAEGVRFDLALSASAVTPVSHATILTGRFPYHHGLRVLSADGGFRLPAAVPTLAGAFQQAGYTTAAVHSAFPVSGYFGFDRHFDRFESFDGVMAEGAQGRSTWDVTQLQRRSDETTRRALEVLDATHGPWFLWIHYWDPHDDVLLPPRPFLEGLPRGEDGRPVTDALYAREIAYLDRQIGRLVSGLRDRGQWEGTLVAVVADHGEGLSDGTQRHGWPFHRMVYQEQIHVPLILRIPGMGAGRTVPDLVRTADVAPTLLDYAGLEPGGPMDGESLRPLLEGLPDEPRVAYADQVNGYDHNAGMVERRPDAAFLYSLTDGPWKLIWRPHMPARVELFHLGRDPVELDNRAAAEPGVVLRLLEDLARRDPWVTGPFPPLAGGGDAGAALEDLGYSGGEVDQDWAWDWRCPRHPARPAEGPGACEACGATRVPVTR